MTSSASKVTALMQVAITVTDVERATAFYRDAVGLPFLFAAGPRLAFFDAGGTRLMLSAPEPGFQAGGSTVLYYRVDDIEGAHREMAGRGVPFANPPHRIAQMPTHDLWLAEFRDPDGNVAALMCELPRA